MPTLLQINITANWGSTGKIAESIGLCAMSHGWDSYIAYGEVANPSKSHLIRIGSRMNQYLHFAEQRIFDNEGLCSRIVTRRFIETIKRIKPDVVHLHNIHDHYLNYRILFEYLTQMDIKVVWTFHDCWAFTGHCMHFVTKDCDRWKTGCHNCLMRGEYPKAVMDRCSRNWRLRKELFQANKNLSIVACSDWIADYVKESFLKDKPLTVIHNGVDLKAFRPMTIEKTSGKFEVLAVSNIWNKDKGLEDIFQLRSMLPEEVEITMIGLTKEQKDSLPAGIVGVERTQNIEELVRYYSTADVLVNPTYADTFPTVNLEALACGTPVITYNTGGSPEAVDGKTGVIVPQGDVVALQNAILQMKLAPLSSVDCRKRAQEQFDKEECFQSYINLYEQIVKA